ncbi:MAG: hypothetical protein Q9165_003208 [Trypethelium subeluteriae]
MSVSTQSTVTEIAVISLIPGSDPHDESSNARKVLRDTRDTAASHHGFGRIRWGTQVEDPSTALIFIGAVLTLANQHNNIADTVYADWDSLSAHENFMKSSDFQRFVKHLGSILVGPPNVTHYEFTHGSNRDLAINAPVTEYAQAMFSISAPDEEFDRIAQGIRKAATDYGKGFRGLSWGHAHEAKTEKGEDCKVAMLIAGWDSVEAHHGFEASKAFELAIAPMAKLVKGSNVKHVHMMEL